MAGERWVLGPQRPVENVTATLSRLQADGRLGEGPVVLISAGWRMDEVDAPSVLARLGRPVLHLPLYHWHDALRGKAPSVEAAWRARQDRILSLKSAWQVRLRHALDGLVALRAMTDVDARVAEIEEADAIAGVRALDAHLLDVMAEITAAHPEALRPWDHEAIAPRRAEIEAALAASSAVLVAGGNVGVLRNRLRYFGVGALIHEANARGAAVIGWSAGAMALSERIVLFYDDPPEGPTWPELFDRGVGLFPDAVFLPHARQRLRLDDPARVALLAARFGPSPCLGLEQGAALRHDGLRWVNEGAPGAVLHLSGDGHVRAWGGVDG
jgi:hypothetical protein